MPTDIRCLVIAIEQYSSAEGLSPKLEGTTSAAFDFIQWLLTVQCVSANQIWLCADPSLTVAGVNRFGTQRSDVRKAIVSLATNARNQTKQLYLFISGHGFAFSTSAFADSADMLVCSEYADLATGGDACVGIPELQRMLSYWIGGADHFYFVDCCRNIIDQTRISPGTLTLSLPPAGDRPFVHTLYSTTSGTQAFTTSGFGKALLDGLNGKGRAKGWTADYRRMQVRYELLKKYVRDKVINQLVAGEPGDGDGLIFDLPNIPINECTISISNAAAADVFDVQLMLRGQKYGTPFQIHGASGKVSAQPDVYTLQVSHPASTVVQVRPPGFAPVDLYDTADAQFEMRGAPPPARGPSEGAPTPLSDISIAAPAHTTIELTNLNSNLTDSVRGGNLQQQVEPGIYRVRVLEDNVTIREHSFSIGPGESQSKDFLELPGSVARDSISKAVGSSLASGVIDFSESLGPTSNSDMGLWLSILGASKIIGRPGLFSKLSLIPTATFEDVAPNSAAIFLLAAFESHAEPVRVGVHSGRRLEWHTAEELAAVSGVQQLKMPVGTPGPGLLSIAIGDHPTSTFVVHTVSNRVTLITLSQESRADGTAADSTRELRHLRRYQYLLPLERLIEHQGYELRNLTESHTDLRSIRAMFTIQQRFCADRAVLTPGIPGEVENLWADAMWGKWLDPMMSVIMCYELIRRGKARQNADQIRMVANNLSRYFGLPDSQAVLNLIGEPDQIPKTAPLFVDGVIPYAEMPSLLPFRASKIDYRSPWTTWRQVVSLNDTETTDERRSATRRAKSA